MLDFAPWGLTSTERLASTPATLRPPAGGTPRRVSCFVSGKGWNFHQPEAEAFSCSPAVGSHGLRHGFPAGASAGGLWSGGWLGRRSLLGGSSREAARWRGCRHARDRAPGLDGSAPRARRLGLQLGQVRGLGREGGAQACFLTGIAVWRILGP